MGRLDEALACFDAIIARTSRYPLAHYNRACALARKGKVQEAVRDLTRASAQEPHFLEDALTDSDFDGIRNSASFRRLFKPKKAQ
jgi:tetratricopeptide (TPR) repeat protein